jgi:hypothetical protein
MIFSEYMWLCTNFSYYNNTGLIGLGLSDFNFINHIHNWPTPIKGDILFLFLKTRFLRVALAIQEVTMQIRLALSLEMSLPLPPECWNCILPSYKFEKRHTGPYDYNT